LNDWIRIEDSEIDSRKEDGYFWCFEDRWEEPYVSFFCSTKGWFFDREESKDWPEYIKEIKEPNRPKL
jgi:hypothetical protein